MSLQFIKAGLQTSIQDLGRSGLMHLGISKSGAMDHNAMKLVNWLLGIPLDSAVFEITLIGPTIKFSQTMSIAITGARFELFLNGNMVFNDEVIHVESGDVLEFDRLQQGARAYLAFTGELDMPPMLNSYSTHLTCSFGGYNNRQLKNNDSIDIQDSTTAPAKKLPNHLKGYYSGNYLIRCVPSVETNQFNQSQLQQFFNQVYRVSADSNRMGVRLVGNPIETQSSIDITSSGLTQGSIQIPPSGVAIISSVDGQTIGGYPRIANVISADLPILGQLKAKDKINFSLIDLDYADQLFSQSNSLFN